MVTEIKEDPKTALKGKPAAVVVFYTEWCGDSQRSMDWEKKLEEDLRGRVEFYRIDCEECEPISEKYNIEHYPTYIFFRKGKAQKGILVEPVAEGQARNWVEMKLGKSAV